MKRIMAVLLSAVLMMALAGCGEQTPIEPSTQGAQTTEFNIGETWTVDGQWSLTIDSVEEMSDRNEYSEKNPAAVYLVSYTYINLGYEDKSGMMDGLFFGDPDSIIDATGLMGYSYPNDVTDYATETPVGATCKAQVCIGVDNAGDFKFTHIKYDGNEKKQTATFSVSVGK